MIIVSNQFDKLDEYITEAALGSISWSQALGLMAPLAGADRMSLDLVFGSNQSVTSLGTLGFEKAMVDAYANYYHRIDPRLACVQNTPGHGVIFDEEIQASGSEDEQDEFWLWLKQSNAPRDAAILVMPCVGDARIMLAVHRERKQACDANLILFFTKFYDKLNAVNAMVRLDGHNRRHALGPALSLRNIDCFDFCVDETLLVADVDDKTRYRLPLTGLARLDDEDRLTALTSDFSIAIASVFQNAPPHHDVQITHKTAIANTILNISAIPGPEFAKLAAIEVTYLKHNSETEQIFMCSFGLTRRQAELLQIMRSVYSLDEAARIMSISRNTARVFLGQIYDRTGVRRKADLLRLADRFA